MTQPKALTVCQPYAELIVSGVKRVENRTWPTAYRGPILIHAGKSREWLQLNEKGTVDQPSGLAVAALQFGYIVGAGMLIDCVQPARYIAEPYARRIPLFSPAVKRKFPWLSEHRHAEGPCCWIIDGVFRLDQPIACGGSLGLWNYKGEITSELAAYLDQ